MKVAGDMLMMEAASTSETLVNFYQITWSNNPRDSHLLVKFCFTNIPFSKGIFNRTGKYPCNVL
jgi:hypothetical protein